MELLKLAEIKSETYEEAIDKAERDQLWTKLRIRSSTLDNLITDKLQIMSFANLESCTKHVGQTQLEYHRLFEIYLKRTGARKDQIDAYNDMVKIVHSSFARLLHYQSCYGMNLSQGEQQPLKGKRAQEVFRGEMNERGRDRNNLRRTGFSTKK